MFMYLICFWVNIQATLNSDGGILHREFRKEAVFMTLQHLGKEKIANYAISTCMYHQRFFIYDDKHIFI